MQQSQNEPAASQPAPLLRVDTAQSAPASALPSPGLRNDHILEPDEGDFDAADPDNEVGTPPLPVQLDGGEAPNAPAAAAQNDMRAHARLLNQQIEAELAREQDPPAERVDGAERIMVQDFANEDEPRPEAPIDEVGVWVAVMLDDSEADSFVGSCFRSRFVQQITHPVLASKRHCGDALASRNDNYGIQA
jgi:hypothetical protein